MTDFLQGVPIKMRLGFCSIALAILIQQDLDYILLKTDIHSFVSNTETFLSDIWKPRYILPKFKYQNWYRCFRSQFLKPYDSTEILIIFLIINLLFEKLTLQVKTIHSDSFAYFETMIWPFVSWKSILWS